MASIKTLEELKEKLHKIDHKGYGEYKTLQGSYYYQGFLLHIDHVQGDPYASPSRFRYEIEAGKHKFPKEFYSSNHGEGRNVENQRLRRIALEDQVLRQFHRVNRESGTMIHGSGKSGKITSCPVGQKVLERMAVLFLEDRMELRFELGLPAKGRTILGKEMEKLLFIVIPSIAKSTLFYQNWREKDQKQLAEAIELTDDQYSIRQQLIEKHWIAFVADGSILPRKNGVSDEPMKGAIPFNSGIALRSKITVPHRGTIWGMGIPEGITTITGGGYHGKSTLLKALEHGVYNHIAGDGREYVIALDHGMKIRAEDGRCVHHTDISMFINHLPNGQNTRSFTTDNASGSTSQATNLVEAFEAGSRLIFIDEDTSATNFMLRDRIMSELIRDDAEPITPLLRVIRNLYEKSAISFVLVVGSSGEYIGVSDLVLQMDRYQIYDVTEKAKKLYSKYALKAERQLYVQEEYRFPDLQRICIPRQYPEILKAKAMGTDSVILAKETIDVRYLEQLCDAGQTVALAYIMSWLIQHMRKNMTVKELMEKLMDFLKEKGLKGISGWYYSIGHPVLPRKQEIYACLNRYRDFTCYKNDEF